MEVTDSLSGIVKANVGSSASTIEEYLLSDENYKSFWVSYKFSSEIFQSESMRGRHQQTGSAILEYLNRRDLERSPELLQLFDINGFMFFKLLALSEVSVDLRADLCRRYQFEEHLGT